MVSANPAPKTNIYNLAQMKWFMAEDEPEAASAGQNPINYAVIAGAVFVTFVVWMFFLASTGDIIGQFVIFDFEELVKTALSLNFILFLLIFPLTYALVISFCTKFRKIEVMAGSVAGTVLGAIVSLLLFAGSMQYWVFLVFYIASLLLMTETTYARLEELKKWVMLRTLNQGMSQACSILAIGMLAFGFVTLLPANEEYVKSMEKNLFEGVSKNVAGGDLMDKLAESSAKSYVQGQKDAIRMLTRTDVYGNSTDAALKALIEGGEKEVSSEGHKQLVTGEYKRQAAAMSSKAQGGELDMTAMVKKQVPFIAVMEQFMWALNSLILASAFMFLAIPFRILGVIYGLIVAKGIFGK